METRQGEVPDLGDDVLKQYQDDRNLNARSALHARFSTNPYGWHRWTFDHLTVLPKRTRILELGCGPGDLWATNLARIPAGWELTLTDFSAGMVEAAQAKLATLARQPVIKVVDAQAIPFEDETFDAVIANHMLYHVPDRRRALDEMRRVLRSDGAFFATTVGDRHMTQLWSLVEPFVPDIQERTSRVSRGFTLENGEPQLAEVFSSITRDDYEDALEVTEVQPVVAYLRSSTTLMACALEPSQWATIRRTVAAHIELKGAFHIDKASGLFIARGGSEVPDLGGEVPDLGGEVPDLGGRDAA
jgi:ubiquinone/menaquinone biosynthesis C-methylase UbiE